MSTPATRFSSLFVGLPFGHVPIPDFGVQLSDREWLSHLYIGIETAAPSIASADDNAGLFGSPPTRDGLPGTCLNVRPAYDSLPTTNIF